MSEEDNDFEAMLGGERFRKRLEWKLFRQIKNNGKRSKQLSSELLLNADSADQLLAQNRVKDFNERVARKLNKQVNSVTSGEYLTSLFDSIVNGPNDGENEYFKHYMFFRGVLKRLIAQKKIDLSEELNSSESQYNLTTRKYGCMSCSYKGTKLCPYGIGLLKATEDIYDTKGFLVTKMGEIMDTHPSKICDEKLAEYHQKFKMYNDLTGLKDARTESLMQMSDFLKVAREKLTDVLEEQKLFENSASPEGNAGSRGLFVVNKDGDTALKTALMQIDAIQQKYHEQLNKAIQQEEGVKQVVERRISADDLNNMIKKAKAIDATSRPSLSKDDLDEGSEQK
jgi:hypothetical protein